MGLDLLVPVRGHEGVYAAAEVNGEVEGYAVGEEVGGVFCGLGDEGAGEGE